MARERRASWRALHIVDFVRSVSHHPYVFGLRIGLTMSLSHAAWQHLIAALHASGRKAALAITGGGSGAIGELLRGPGGSRVLVRAEGVCDPTRRAARLVPAGSDLVGLGATAALVSDRPRRGEHRFHVACASSAGVAHCTAVL